MPAVFQQDFSPLQVTEKQHSAAVKRQQSCRVRIMAACGESKASATDVPCTMAGGAHYAGTTCVQGNTHHGIALCPGRVRYIVQDSRFCWKGMSGKTVQTRDQTTYGVHISQLAKCVFGTWSRSGIATSSSEPPFAPRFLSFGDIDWEPVYL